MAIRLVHPYAHRLVLEHGPRPVYVDCVAGSCRICGKIEAARNMKLIDEIVRRIFGA